jgi:phosphatidylserine/phosphatidylglycerophosphate/cardiolipin synthase-like enzyme
MVRDSVFWLAILPTMIQLIDGGVEVWAWQGNQPLLTAASELGCTPPTLPGASLHAKLVHIDNRVAMVHSSNLNYRSVHYNTEIGAILLDPPLVAEVAQIFDDLVEGRSRRFECLGDAGEQAIEMRTLVRMDAARVPELRAQLGGLSRFVESMSLLW